MGRDRRFCQPGCRRARGPARLGRGTGEGVTRKLGLIGWVAALASFGALGDAAEALDRKVRIVNATDADIVAFYGSPVGARPSERSLLGADILPAGGSMVLDFEDGSGYCRYAFRAVFADAMELNRASVNICEVGLFRYTD
jgi:hypothetical protein